MSRALRWLTGVLAGSSGVLAVAALVDGDLLPAGLWAVAGTYWSWQLRRVATAPVPTSTEVDEEWARGVLTAAGDPRGASAVKALREAEPGLSLLQAKRLADRVAG